MSAQEVPAEPRPPEGVTLREVSDRRALRRIEAMEQAIWHEDESRLADRLEAERAVAPDELVVVTAEAGRRVVCAGWVPQKAQFPAPAVGTPSSARCGTSHSLRPSASIDECGR